MRERNVAWKYGAVLLWMLLFIFVLVYPVKAEETEKAGGDGTAAEETTPVKLDTPVISVTNVAESGKPRITWEKVKGASEYEVYRSTSKDGKYTKIFTTKGTSCTNVSAKAGTAYYYKVKAIHTNQAANSEYSKVKSRTCDLPQPTGIQASNMPASGKVKLTWNKVSGAVKYVVYRSTSKNGTYKKMFTTTGTSYINTAAKPGVTYYYKVKAVHTLSAANSAQSEAVRRTCDLAKPSIQIQYSISNRSMKITWSEITGADQYQIYGCTSKNGTYQLLGTSKKSSFVHQSPKEGKTWYYKIKAVNTGAPAADSVYSSKKSYYVVDSSKKLVALTFDDGPGPYTKEIVDCLKANQAHATFFVLGQNVDNYKSAVKYAFDNGNEIGNHTYSHPELTMLSWDSIQSQINKTNRKVKAITGQNPTIMRPPGGGFNSTVKSAVGMPLIYWSVDTRDWETLSSSSTYYSVMKYAGDGEIILMHDIHRSTKEAALEIIPALKKNGYELVTVSELAEYKGYNMKKGVVYFSFD